MTKKVRAPKRASNPEKNLRILVAHGVNLDLLGRREPETYGKVTLPQINRAMSEVAPSLSKLHGAPLIELQFMQTNDEAQYLAAISEDWHGLVLNPGAWTHTSLALADRLAGLETPFVEVHISNLAQREDFRKFSYLAPYASGIVYGFGATGYIVALHGLIARFGGG